MTKSYVSFQIIFSYGFVLIQIQLNIKCFDSIRLAKLTYWTNAKKKKKNWMKINAHTKKMNIVDRFIIYILIDTLHLTNINKLIL